MSPVLSVSGRRSEVQGQCEWQLLGQAGDNPEGVSTGPLPQFAHTPGSTAFCSTLYLHYTAGKGEARPSPDWRMSCSRPSQQEHSDEGTVLITTTKSKKGLHFIREDILID